MESLGRTDIRHFSAFLVDETSNPPMPARPVHQPHPTRAKSFFGLRKTPTPTITTNANTNTNTNDHADDEIPVLEGTRSMSTFLSEGEDDDDDDDDDDEDDGEDDDDDAQGNLENVPVLQTIEDANAHSQQHASSKRSKAKGTLRKLTRRSPKRQTASTVASSSFTSTDSPLIFDHKDVASLYTQQQPQQQSEQHRQSNSRRNDASRASLVGNGSTHRHMVRSGWLIRQGQHLKTWKRRYFVLIKRTNVVTGEYTASLQYYKGTNFGKLRGEIDLHEGGSLTIRFVDVSESKKPFCFELSRGEFSLYLQGKDDEDVSAWVWHLQTLTVRTPNEMLASSGADARMSVPASNASTLLASLPSSIASGSRGIFIMAELRRLLHNSKSPEASKCKTFVKNFECRSASSLRQLRDLHASVADSIIRIHGARIIAMSEEKAQIEQQTGPRSSSIASPLKMSDLRMATSRHVEDVLYTPLQETISGFLRRAYGEDDVILNRKLRWLQGKDQTYYNIPLHQNSWKDWRKASKLLSHVAVVPLPTAKYDILVATMKEIQIIYAEEHDQIYDEQNQLETDDLIPIFTYVLANSGLDNLLALKQLLRELNGAWAVGGSLDNGTALNVYEYAVDFISSVSIPAVLEDIFRDQVTLSIDGEWRQVLELEVEPTYRYGAVARQISPQGLSTIGSSISRGHVLVTVNGQNVVLWPYVSISALLKESTPPHRLAFIPAASYFKILTSTKALWNVALVNACQRGDIASVQMLLANGADVNYVAHECGGNTPLHIAVSASHLNVVSYILQHGAKARTLGEYGRSALHMVGLPCTLPSPSLSAAVTVASSVPLGNSLRHSGVGNFKHQDKVMMIIKRLLTHGTPIDSTDIFGFTPLHLLARKGLVNGIDVIVEFSAGEMDLNSRNWQHGMGALALAARDGHQEVVDALLDYGVQPDLCNLNGDTALHFAASIGSTSICRALIDRGCDVDVRNRDGVTPLMIAAGTAGFALSEKTAAAAVPSVVGKPGKSKTSRAAKNRVDPAALIDTIDCLINAGADLYAVCNLYRLPVHYAAMYGTRAVYEHLNGKMNTAVDGLRRDLLGKSAMAIMDERRNMLTPSSCDVQLNDEDENEMRESQVEPQSDFQLLVESEGRRASEKVECGDNLIVEIAEDDQSQRIVVAGTLGAICDELYQFQSYKLEDVAALINTCTVASYQSLIDHLRERLRIANEGSDEEKVYVRRMVLHSVDLMVHSFLQKVELDTEVCSCIHEFCCELFPFKVDDDPPCGQWIASSLLPTFAEAVRAQRMYDLRISSPCETAYETLRGFLKNAKRSNPTMKFLDDDLFASTFGVEVITEAMRRRMSIAGVWQGEALKLCVVRADPSESPSAMMNRKSLAPVALTKGRSVNTERAPRLWLLDVDVSVLAEQITLFQHYLFSQIRVSELLESKRSAEKTPAYDRLRQLHNHISVWVVNQILCRNDVEQRAQILARFIKVAATCLQPLQNFDGFMAIMNATNDSSVFRLKKTWSRLQPEVRDQWHELKKCTENGARSLHKTMKDAVPPTIPYLGVVMQNIIAVQEFPDRTDTGLINFKKIRLLGHVVKRFTSLQSSPYLLQVDKRILDQVCATLLYPDADVCFERSLQIEPRIPTS